MGKMFNWLKILALVLFFLGSSRQLKAQYTDSFEVPDSLYDMMAQMDSIYDEWSENDSTQNLLYTNCPNSCNCKKKNNYIPQKDEILFFEEDKYALIYEDNFDNINTAFWNVIDNCGEECWYDPEFGCEQDWKGNYNNGDRQWLQKENVRIEKGPNEFSSVAIDLKRDPGIRPWPNDYITPIDKYYEFTSGFLKSKKGLPYGTCVIEARIKLPPDIKDGRMNPAFWLMGFDNHNTELDIFEFFDTDKKMSTTLHSGGSKCTSTKTQSNSFFNDWHIYRCYWNKAFIAVQVDRKNWTIARNHVVSTKYGKNDKKDATIFLKKDVEVEMREVYPNKGMRIMLNNQIEKCDNRRNSNVSFPQTMEIDWIKVYYRLPCNKDIVINDVGQIPQVEQEINILAGKTITCNVSTPLNPNIYLKVIHTGDFIGNQLIVGPNGFVEMIPTEPFNCTMESPKEIVENQNIIEKDLKVYYNIFPNPTGDNFNLISKEGLELNLNVKIYNLSNNLIKKFKVATSNSTAKIEISTLPDGIYLVEIFDKKGRKEVKKLVVCQN